MNEHRTHHSTTLARCSHSLISLGVFCAMSYFDSIRISCFCSSGSLLLLGSGPHLRRFAVSVCSARCSVLLRSDTDGSGDRVTASALLRCVAALRQFRSPTEEKMLSQVDLDRVWDFRWVIDDFEMRPGRRSHFRLKLGDPPPVWIPVPPLVYNNTGM